MPTRAVCSAKSATVRKLEAELRRKEKALAEALFRTTKYHPSMPPNGFLNLTDAREWTDAFVNWYNNTHKHSAIQFVTPAQKHQGLDTDILAKRKQHYEENRSAPPPRRWIQGKTRNCNPIQQTSLNPIDNRNLEKILKKSA